MSVPLDLLALFLPVADHGDVLAALPFFLPAFLIVGVIFAMRAIERRRDSHSVSDARRETDFAPLAREDNPEDP
jgi:hypothetical protein